jgi:trans-aconitate methyltransferase
MSNSDKHWRRLGRFDPYLKTVKTLDPYKLDPRLHTGNVVEPYFESGSRYVSDLFDTINQHVTGDFIPNVGVDFGCSVGRIAIPLAKRCKAVIGLDVSSDVLAEAERNAVRLNVTNVSWASSDDELTEIKEPIGLFHSYNVFQHLAVDRGLRIMRRALEKLTSSGVIAVHVPYQDKASQIRQAINWAQAHVPGVHAIANVVRGRAPDYPHMLMNVYSINDVFSLLRAAGCTRVHCNFVDQERYPGAVIIGRKGQ